LQRQAPLMQLLVDNDLNMASLPAAGAAARLAAFQEKRILNLTSSADGTMYAFQIMGGPLCVAKNDGSNIVELGEGERPSFAPDGRHIVYMIARDDGHNLTASDLFIIATDGSGKVNLTGSDGPLEINPAWSPRGDAILYERYDSGEIWMQPLLPTQK
jgi:Tol biopolymer transport system component